jgi:hypothetical protein
MENRMKDMEEVIDLIINISYFSSNIIKFTLFLDKLKEKKEKKKCPSDLLLLCLS